MECIILAGGLGTRLKTVVDDVPKCMAPINGQPFLSYLISFLKSQGCKRFIFSLGYKHEVVLDWLSTQEDIEFDYVIENAPLGTGGGISLALSKVKEANVFVLNGDTMFMANMKELETAHSKQRSETTIALKHLKEFERYGSVDINEHNMITSFNEKQFCEDGLINGGIYCINVKQFRKRAFLDKYSFEQDYLTKFVNEQSFSGYTSNEYFIDIGIPEDYQKAQQDFKEIFK